MDGNKRWSRKNKLTLRQGYLKGLSNIRQITKCCINQDIKNLTIYALSSENLKRPTVGTIFSILNSEYKKIFNEFEIENLVKIKIIGERKNLPKNIINIINEIEKRTKDNKKINLNIAFNYGTDKEIISIFKKIIKKENSKKISINKKIIYNNLYLSQSNDPDLLVRTGGYKRLSNFILLNLSYTELFFTDTLWPDLSEKELKNIFNNFYKIKRNYGL
tara:strand:+ start:233 stop:886 length:654 start_codon:yes stop_codon:yes gene_type:complete